VSPGADGPSIRSWRSARRRRSRVEAALASLPESERGVFALICWTELRPEDAARALGLEPCRVRSLHARALQRLRVRLRELYE
jgi:DNA-directed RNA polymerase specialized sigma24 family protein